MKKKKQSSRIQHRVPPTLTQIETIKELNKKLGTNWPVPDNEMDARFLIDGMVDEDRRKGDR